MNKELLVKLAEAMNMTAHVVGDQVRVCPGAGRGFTEVYEPHNLDSPRGCKQFVEAYKEACFFMTGDQVIEQAECLFESDMEGVFEIFIEVIGGER